MKPPTFEEAVRRAWNTPQFMREYRRLTGHALGLDERTTLERMIDAASGYAPPLLNELEVVQFLDFVRDYIWLPAVAAAMQERS